MCTTCASDARGQGTCTMPAPARSALCKDENRVYVVGWASGGFEVAHVSRGGEVVVGRWSQLASMRTEYS